MSDELIKRLREWLGSVHTLKSRLSSRSRTEFYIPGSLAPELLRRSEEMCDEVVEHFRDAADLIEQQAARIAELEAQIATVAPAVDAQPVAIQAGDDVTVTNVPARIYLNLGDLYEMGEIPFQSLTDVTWCEDRIDDADIEYVRADASAQSEGLRKDAERLDWLDKNMFHREMNEWDARIHRGETMWVMFAPNGVQGSARNVIDAVLPQHNTGEKDD